MPTNEKSEIKLNEKGQCPFCKIKPLIYKRDKKYWCHKCSREFDLITGVFQENFSWTKDNQCKHNGRPKKSKCPRCGEWDNGEEIAKLYPKTPDKLAEAKKIIENWESNIRHNWGANNDILVEQTLELLAAQDLISRSEERKEIVKDCDEAYDYGYERGREDQKKESVAKKQYGNEEIQKMFEKLIPKLQEAGIHGFSDSQRWARIYARHLVNLQKKLGEKEFDRRVDALLSDSFHRKNCNKIKYLYSNINGFVEPKINISTLVI